MKNLKIAKKLIVVFGIIAVLFITVTITAITSLMSTGSQFTSFYDEGYEVTNTSMDARRVIQSACKNIGYAIMTEDVAQTKVYIDSLGEDAVYLNAGINELKTTFKGDQSLINDCLTLLKDGASVRAEVSALALAGKNDQASALFFETYRPVLVQIQDKLMQLNEAADASADQSFNDSKSAEQFSMIVLCSLAAIALLAMIILAFYITRSLTRPIKEIETAARQMAEGSLNAIISYESKDELGLLSHSMRVLIHGLAAIVKDIGYLLGEMANGNFQVSSKSEPSYIGDYMPLLNSVRNINSSLSDTLTQINQASEQVSSGSEQVSGGAQALSQGATEQASSIEELSASITEVSQQIQVNASGARDASTIANQTGNEMLKCNQKMREMINAMDEISNSSSEIGKIIKTIEDIAFQTNILALNAAVEAARAGSAGKGFAVVADEVRNLASKSAQASKNTAELIENSLKAVASGTTIANDTAISLSQSVESSTKVTATIDKISQASSEQAQSISQITQGIDQISSVVQTNSATAEESAAASEELSGQAQMLKTLVSQFKLKKSSTDFY